MIILKKYFAYLRMLIKYFLNWIIFFFCRPLLAIKYFPRWIKDKDHGPELGDMPWFNYEAIEWLNSFLKPEMKVFEWGSGSSTLYFSRRVQDVVSIEHNKDWDNIVSKIIGDGTKNCSYFFIGPEIDTREDSTPHLSPSYLSTDKNYQGKSFRTYCESITKYPDNHFDIISIDGRARNSCAYWATSKVKDGGILILDNADLKEYTDGQKILEGWTKKYFYGPGPFTKNFWGTAVYFK
jgi:hypothetical protein